MTTRAPSEERWRATAAPMPCEPPVMRATLPARDCGEVIFAECVDFNADGDARFSMRFLWSGRLWTTSENMFVV